MDLISRVGIETVFIDEQLPTHGAEGGSVSFESSGEKITNHTEIVFQDKNDLDKMVNSFIYPSAIQSDPDSPQTFYKNIDITTDIVRRSVADNPQTAKVMSSALQEISSLKTNIDLLRSHMLSIQQG
jgi:hypothetical protein